ncbi:hypothetical protein NP493_1105g00019 [Ridgeia piscesae]|uniref:Uncharacterized protein n=1 Tax=Ridgeia piscesae TaxID=27915 RepID=A0AAD9KIB5_RIDPI|nr:hypothetical protein NP493_1105g00019 [Ridgeia piscesae]
MKVTASCQRRKAQGKHVVCPTKVPVALPLVQPPVTNNVDSAVDPGPVETDSETDSQCCWSTVVKKTKVDDPKVFLDGHIWPEGIFVRWCKPSEKAQRSNTRKTDCMDDDLNGDS